MLYHIGGVAILHSPDTQQQRHYNMHNEEVKWYVRTYSLPSCICARTRSCMHARILFLVLTSACSTIPIPIRPCLALALHMPYLALVPPSENRTAWRCTWMAARSPPPSLQGAAWNCRRGNHTRWPGSHATCSPPPATHTPSRALRVPCWSATSNAMDASFFCALEATQRFTASEPSHTPVLSLGFD